MQLVDYLLIGGCALVALGAGMLSIPAGVITAGVCMIGMSVLIARKQADDESVE